MLKDGLACTHLALSIGASIAWCCRWGIGEQGIRMQRRVHAAVGAAQ